MFYPIPSCASFYVISPSASSVLRCVATLLLGFVASTVSGQGSGRFNIGVGIGLNAVQNAGRNLDNGWAAGVRGGLNLGRHIDADLDYSYSQFGMKSAALALFGERSGIVEVWSLAFQPQWHLRRAPATLIHT